VLRATSALLATAWTLRPSTGFAAWGEDWGDMVWGASAPPAAVPLLGPEGLLLLTAVLTLVGICLARRRRA
jgi:hypothetical protein